MKLLWIGEHTNNELIKKLCEYGYTPMSISIAQENLIKGIQNYHPIDTISGCRLPCSYKRGRILFKGCSWEEPDNSKHIFVNLLNIKYVELIFKKNMLKKAAHKWALKNKDDDCYIIVYGLHSPYLACIPVILRIIPKAKVTCIVPDLPEYYDFNMGRIKSFLKKIDLIEIYKHKKFIDKYVLFANNMSRYLQIPKDKYIVVEGSIYIKDKNIQDAGFVSQSNKKIVLYTGAVSHGYGIDILLDAFTFIDDENYELWIAGIGNAVDLVINAAKDNSRIKYLGYINDKAKLSLLQQKATMLMCMIPPENKATQYCFPSKILEYMLSGNPTLAFRLQGVEDEYYDFLIEMDSTIPKYVAKKIIEIGSMTNDERRAIGEKSKDFIIQNKNSDIQAKKILDFMLA